MKKVKIFLIGVICSLLFPSLALAASGSISVTGSSSAIVGNRITITVTLSSGTNIGSWEMYLNYDKTYLQLVSSTGESGGTSMVNSSSGTKSKSYTFQFKALKSGTTRISIPSYLVYATDQSEMSISSGTKSVRIMTQEELEATYSKDNNLKSLSVEGFEMDQEFNKDVLKYSVTVPTGTTKVKINATKNDSTASISGVGEQEVTEGLNTFQIIVTAQNGSEKTYTLIVNVEDQNPIEVKVNGKTYTVVKNASLLEAPKMFSDTTIKINDNDIPAFINTIANITLVGLKDSSGSIGLFQYKDGSYDIYNEINLKNLILIPTTFEKELNYIKTTININGEEVDAYKYSNYSEFVIISAKDLETGDIELYLYDTKNNTAIRFDEEFIDYTKDTIKNYSNVIIILCGIVGLMLIIVFSLIYRLRKNSKRVDKFVKKQEAKIEATRKLNDVVEEVKKITEKENQKSNKNTEIKKQPTKKKDVDEEIEVKELKVKNHQVEEKEEEEVYDLFEDDKKKKKKK